MAGPSTEVPPALRIFVSAWAAWREGEDGVSIGGDIRPAAALPASLRRRITPIGRRALETAWAVLAGRAEAPPRIILSSRHGEYARTLGLLTSLTEGGEVSPAEFSLAVHHGLAGLLSIAAGNRAGHTAVAAGADTLGAALEEAAACLAEGENTILLMHFDEPLPEDYAPVGGGPEPRLALALLLGGEGLGLRLCRRPAGGAKGPGPAAALARLLRAETKAEESAGDRMIWSLSHAA